MAKDAVSTTILDLRRSDLRGNVLSNAYWITSAEINKDADWQCALLFSFPVGVADISDIGLSYGRDLILVHQVVLEVVTAFTGGTPYIMIGQGSIATDDVTTAGTMTISATYPDEEDTYLGKSDVTMGTAGWYGNGSFGMSWQADRKNQKFTDTFYIIPSDTNVRCVTAHLWADDDDATYDITAGRARLHLMISRVPSMARD